MDRVLQAQENAQNSFQENIQPGRVGSLFLYFEGTNAAGLTGDLDDLGTVIVKRYGETIVNRPVPVLGDIWNVLMGSNLLDSTEASTFKATVIIPFWVKSFWQALEIQGSSELNFQYQPHPDQATAFDDLTLSVYSEMSFLNEEYVPFLLGDDQTPAAAVSSRPYQLNAPNIASIFVRDPSDDVTSIGLRQNGEQRFSDQPKAVLEGGTLGYNRMEQSTTPILELQCYTEREPRSLINQNTILELTTSGGGNEISITRQSIRVEKGTQGRARN